MFIGEIKLHSFIHSIYA